MWRHALRAQANRRRQGYDSDVEVAQKTDDLRDDLRRRDEFLARVPRWYRGEAHFFATNLCCIAILWVVLRGVSQPTWWDLGTAPIAFLYANYFEWRLHKGP